MAKANRYAVTLSKSGVKQTVIYVAESEKGAVRFAKREGHIVCIRRLKAGEKLPDFKIVGTVSDGFGDKRSVFFDGENYKVGYTIELAAPVCSKPKYMRKIS